MWPERLYSPDQCCFPFKLHFSFVERLQTLAVFIFYFTQALYAELCESCKQMSFFFPEKLIIKAFSFYLYIAYLSFVQFSKVLTPLHCESASGHCALPNIAPLHLVDAHLSITNFRRHLNIHADLIRSHGIGIYSQRL